MANPTQSDSHVDTALTNISVAYLQNQANFVASRAFPNVPVAKQSDRYFVFDKGDFRRNEAEKRAAGTESAGSGYALDNTPTYFADVWAFHKDVPDQVRSNSDPAADPDKAAALFVAQKMMLAKEIDWVSSFFAASVWDTDITGVASSPGASQVVQWSDTTSGDPIGDLRTAKTTILESTGYMPNTLVVNQHVMDALEDHPDIVDRIKYSTQTNANPARANEQTLAALFGIDRVLVSRASQNTAARSLADANAFIAGNGALLCYSAPAPDLMSPTAGYTMSWTGYLGNGNEFGMAVSNMRMDNLRSDRIEAEMAFDHKVVSTDMGYFFASIAA